MNTFHNRGGAQKGFSMIEVLVTLIILLIGLLGLAGMMMHSQRAEAESYHRSQALLLLQDMVGRINANRNVASCYAITSEVDGAPYLGSGVDTEETPPTCTTGSAAQQATAIQDMIGWSNLLTGSAELSGTTSVGAMIGARGCVSSDVTTGIYRVSVAWQGLGSSASPPAALGCGKDLYGDESHRRIASVTLQFASLIQTAVPPSP